MQLDTAPASIVGLLYDHYAQRVELDVEGDAFIFSPDGKIIWWYRHHHLPGGLDFEANEAIMAKFFPALPFQWHVVIRTTEKTDLTVTLGNIKQSVSADQAATGDARAAAYNYFILANFLRNALFAGENAAGWAIFQERQDYYDRILLEIVDKSGVDVRRINEVFEDSGLRHRSHIPLARQFDLFSGTAAIRGNLDLHTVPTFTGEHARTIDINTVRGITAPEIDWVALLANDPEYRLNEPLVLDPLAYYVPEDQHFVVFPSVKAALQVLELVNQHGLIALATPLAMTGGNATTADYRLVRRYLGTHGLMFEKEYDERFAELTADPEIPDNLVQQILSSFLSLGVLAACPHIKSVAITGSDPYFREGTDIAVLFETDEPEKLATLFPSPLRVETIGENTVLLADSPFQRERIKSVVETGKSLAALDEFRFFRTRYQVGDPDETVFIFISDATIRRWCSPQWRIGQARRLQQQVRMAALTVERMNDIIAMGTFDVASFSLFDDPLQEYTYGMLNIGIFHETYGRYAFLRPIASLNIDKISEAEKTAYEQWRDRFEGIWQGAFDPIGIRLTLGENVAKTDLTVLPVNRLGLRQLGAGVVANNLPPTTARYDVPMQVIAALNAEALQGMGLPPDETAQLLFSWLGNYISIYFDEDPFWDALRKHIEEKGLFGIDFQHADLMAPPVVLEVASKDKESLDAFIDKMVESFNSSFSSVTPDDTQNLGMQRLQHGDTPYFSFPYPIFVLTANDMRLYVAATEDRLLVSLNEDTLKRALDRLPFQDHPLPPPQEGNNNYPSEEEVNNSPPVEGGHFAQQNVGVVSPTTWLGSSLGFKLDARAMGVLDTFIQPALDAAAQRGNARNAELFAWYRERFPQHDPVQLHQRLFGERLLLPEEMPRQSPLTGLQWIEFGITLEEHDGIRARGEVRW